MKTIVIMKHFNLKLPIRSHSGRILFFFFAIPFLGLSQMTEANAPESGTTSSLYLCDSNAILYENIVGTNVVWDYNNILGIDADEDGTAELIALSVSDTNKLSNDTLFAGSKSKFSINDQFITYYNTSDLSRLSQGFKISEPSIGDIFIFWNKQPQLLNPYPFDFDNKSYTKMSGRIFSDNPDLTIDTTAIGGCFSTIDGIGTLKLSGVEYPNTFRYHFQDTINFYVKINFLGQLFDEPVTIYRDVYEYYNYSKSKLPIFMIYSIKNTIMDNPTTIVLSNEKPMKNLSVSQQELASQVKIYPNPSQDYFNVQLPLGSSATLFDAVGKPLFRLNDNFIDLRKREAGIYFLEVRMGKEVMLSRIVKN
jgi:hypothetical protein